MNELYKVSGRVMQGEKRGKNLGFPTANVRLHKKIPEGIYAATVLINGKTYHSATFVGSAKTFQSTQVRVESFLLNFSGDLYGKWITVRLYKKIRDNKEFGSVDELVAQMHQDVEKIQEFFATEKEGN
jgi:riboflavin kinase / FMN adenylyltransferase